MKGTPKLIKVSRLFKPKYFLRKPDDALPALSLEKKIAVMPNKKGGSNLQIYTTFYEYLSTYLMKLPNSPAKQSVDSLVTRNLIYLGSDVNMNTKNGIIGTNVFNNKNLAGVVLDSVELGIDMSTGETDNADSCVYAAYFLHLRAATIYNAQAIMRDDKVHQYAIEYLKVLFMRLIGVNIHLSDKQKDFLEFICSYFYRRFLLASHHAVAVEDSLSNLSTDYIDETKHLSSRLERYTHMKDIFKALGDYMITSDSPSMIMMKVLQKYNNVIFYSITSTLDYLLALVVVSRYPAQFAHSANVNINAQKKLEDIMVKYIKRVKYDVGVLEKM